MNPRLRSRTKLKNRKKKKTYTLMGHRGVQHKVNTAVHDAVKQERKEILELVEALGLHVTQQVVEFADAGIKGTIQGEVDAHAYIELVRRLTRPY